AYISSQWMTTPVASLSKNLASANGISMRLSGDALRTDGYQTTPDAFLNTVPGKTASSATHQNAQVSLYYTPAGSFTGFLRAGYHRSNEDVGGYQYGANLQKGPDAAAGFTQFLGVTGGGDV